MYCFKISKYLCVLLAFQMFSITRSEVFTALMDVSQLKDKRIELAEALEDYVSKETVRIEQLRQFSNKLKSSMPYLKNGSDLFHPIYAYLTIKRLTSDWKDLVHKASTESKEQLELHVEKMSLPDEDDINGAMEAIIRLQDTYSLPPSLLATGRLKRGISSSRHVLSADECFRIGSHAYSKGEFYFAKSWLNEALLLMDNRTVSEHGLLRSTVLDHLAFIAYKQNRITEALALSRELLQLDNSNERVKRNILQFEQLLHDEVSSNGRLGDAGNADDEEAMLFNHPHRTGWYASEEFQQYQHLCRGDPLPEQQQQQQSKQLCRLHIPHAYFILAPLREEIVRHDHPRIVLWHRVIGDNEIEIIKQLAKPIMRRATVQDPKTGQLVTATYRVSKSAWLHASMHPLVKDIDQRIQLMTGLDVSTAEELQIANYGLGGHYEPHYDFALRRDRNAFERAVGNRIATLLFYISNVQSGGATVFTQLGVQVLPTKGSAAFWFNLRSSGHGELLTRHAACPVLHGSKWVMNKWFHERGQEFRRPCDLNSTL